MDLTGMRFGSLLVLSYSGREKRKLSKYPGRAAWNTRCDCGIERVIIGEDMVSGKTRTCARHGKPAGDASPRWLGYGMVNGDIFSRMKRNAARGGKEFSITIEYCSELFEKQGGRCALSGVPIKILPVKSPDNTASMDRIDSSRGYLVGNVQWVHKDVNRIKTDMPQDYFIKLCEHIAMTQKIKKASK